MLPLETSVLASLSFTAQSLDDDDDDDGQTPGLVQHCCCNQTRILHFGQPVCSMGHEYIHVAARPIPIIAYQIPRSAPQTGLILTRINLILIEIPKCLSSAPLKLAVSSW